MKDFPAYQYLYNTVTDIIVISSSSNDEKNSKCDANRNSSYSNSCYSDGSYSNTAYTAAVLYHNVCRNNNCLNSNRWNRNLHPMQRLANARRQATVYNIKSAAYY